MKAEERAQATAVRVKQLETLLLEQARVADRGASDVTLAMGHDGGRGWDPDAHLMPIVEALREAESRGRARGLEELRRSVLRLLRYGIGPGGGSYTPEQRLPAAISLLEIGWGSE